MVVHFMDYLGFPFDGRVVTLRDKTVSKYYYKLYRKLKSCENVYIKYSIKGSHVGDGNFIYVKRVEKNI